MYARSRFGNRGRVTDGPIPAGRGKEARTAWKNIKGAGLGGSGWPRDRARRVGAPGNERPPRMVGDPRGTY